MNRDVRTGIGLPRIAVRLIAVAAIAAATSMFSGMLSAAPAGATTNITTCNISLSGAPASSSASIIQAAIFNRCQALNAATGNANTNTTTTTSNATPAATAINMGLTTSLGTGTSTSNALSCIGGTTGAATPGTCSTTPAANPSGGAVAAVGNALNASGTTTNTAVADASIGTQTAPWRYGVSLSSNGTSIAGVKVATIGNQSFTFAVSSGSSGPAIAVGDGDSTNGVYGGATCGGGFYLCVGTVVACTGLTANSCQQSIVTTN